MFGDKMSKSLWCARLLAGVLVSGMSVSAVAGPVPGQGTWETSRQARDWAGKGVGVDAYYDPFLNLTWLADANRAQTSGFDADGYMDFSAANARAAGLTLFGAGGWRLPTVTPVNGSILNTDFSNNGSTDYGTATTGVGRGSGLRAGLYVLRAPRQQEGLQSE